MLQEGGNSPEALPGWAGPQDLRWQDLPTPGKQVGPSRLGWAMSLQVHPGPTTINLIGLPSTWGLSMCSSQGRWERDRVTCSQRASK